MSIHGGWRSKGYVQRPNLRAPGPSSLDFTVALPRVGHRVGGEDKHFVLVLIMVIYT